MDVGNVEDLGLEQRLLPLERVLAADHHDLELVVLEKNIKFSWVRLFIIQKSSSCFTNTTVQLFFSRNMLHSLLMDQRISLNCKNQPVDGTS